MGYFCFCGSKKKGEYEMSDEFGGFDEAVELEIPETPEFPEKKAIKKTVKKIRKITPVVSERQKFIDKILKSTGKEKLPELDEIFAGRNGTKVKIKDIAVFIGDNFNNEILNDLSKQMQLRNSINLSTEVNIKRVTEVAKQIIQANRVFMAIEVAELTDGTQQYECWTGRHRIIALAILYGADVEIPVIISKMNMNEARDAVVYANQSRKILSLEKSEHTILKNSHGNIEETSREELYNKVVTGKRQANEFALFSCMTGDNIENMKITFPVSKDSSRNNGEFTTTASIKKYLTSVLSDWSKKTTIHEYDEELENGIAFINAYVNEVSKMEGFDPKQQMSYVVMTALGHMHKRFTLAIKNPNDTSVIYAKMIAEIMIEYGDRCARENSEFLIKHMTEKVKEKIQTA